MEIPNVPVLVGLSVRPSSITTPGSNCAVPSKSRPLIGSSAISSGLTFALRVGVPGSIRTSFRSPLDVCPSRTVTKNRLLRKFLSSIRIVYTPAFRAPVEYLPSLSVVRDSGTSAVRELSATLAPETGAPTESITVPSMEPFGSSSCANPATATKQRVKNSEIRNTENKRRLLFPAALEARNFNKRFSPSHSTHAGTASWNRSPREWLLPLYKVELPILLEVGISTENRAFCPRPMPEFPIALPSLPITTSSAFADAFVLLLYLS